MYIYISLCLWFADLQIGTEIKNAEQKKNGKRDSFVILQHSRSFYNTDVSHFQGGCQITEFDPILRK